jgi:hypothetical protein
MVFWNGVLMEEGEDNDYVWRGDTLYFNRRDVHPERDKIRVLQTVGFEERDFEVVTR